MTLLLLIIMILVLMLLSYNRVPLLVCVGILAAITILLTEAREYYYTPHWFRWTIKNQTWCYVGLDRIDGDAAARHKQHDGNG